MVQRQMVKIMTALDNTTICPYCFRTYDSQYEWADHFYDKHTIWRILDRFIPGLNTPHKEAQYMNKQES